MKRLVLSAVLSVAAAAFAVPSTASARWTENHFDIPQGENRLIHAEGTWQYSLPFFSTLHCTQVTATLQITGGTTTSHLTQFSPSLPSCTLKGGLSSCTVNALTIEGLPWTGHASATKITQSGLKIQQHMTGLFCPQTLQLEPTPQYHPELELTTPNNHPVLEPVNTAGKGNSQTITALNFGASLRVTSENMDIGTSTSTATFTLTPSDSHRYGWPSGHP